MIKEEEKNQSEQAKD